MGADATSAPIVFFDIAGLDLARQAAFYQTIFGWSAGAGGALMVPVASPLPGALRIEAPSQGSVAERVLYVGVPDIGASLASIQAHGGAVIFGRTAVPGVVVLAMFTDPEGNRMGLVELGADGKPVVPPAP